MEGITNLTAQDNILIEEMFSDFCNKLARRFEGRELAALKEAFVLAFSAHKNQKRNTGELFITHPIEVALIVGNEIGLGLTSLQCALMHDVVEDSSYTQDFIKEQFTGTIAQIIKGLTKIKSKQDYDRDFNEQAETFKKLIESIPVDLRIILIKIADRVHNMRTLEGMADRKQHNKAGETLMIYAPLAHRLGLQNLKNELEDASFQYMNPTQFAQLTSIIIQHKANRQTELREFGHQLVQLLQPDFPEIKAKIVEKSILSIHRFMEEHKVPFNHIYNYMSLRLIFEADDVEAERAACYQIFEKITRKNHYRDKSLKDYIKTPKENGFKALIIDLREGKKDWIEVQIMSQTMNDIADRGYTSSHSKNKERLKWINKLHKEIAKNEGDALDFLNEINANFYNKEIHVFTPNSEIRTLPKGATVLDFAFEIHTDLGYSCIGAEIDHKLVNPDHVLKGSEIVKILATHSAKPNPAWLNVVVSANAKTALKSYFSKERQKLIETGKSLYQNILKDFGLENDKIPLNKLLNHFKCQNINDFYQKIGDQIISPEQLSKAIKYRTGNSSIRRLSNLFGINSDVKGDSVDLINDQNFSHKKKYFLDELHLDINYTLAQCCNPIPGDESGVYQTKNNQLVAHRTDCKNYIHYNASDYKSVALAQWGEFKNKQFPVKIRFYGKDRKGVMLEVLQVITGKMDVNISSININAEGKSYEGDIGLYVHNVGDLKKIESTILKVKNVSRVVRIN